MSIFPISAAWGNAACVYKNVETALPVSNTDVISNNHCMHLTICKIINKKNEIYYTVAVKDAINWTVKS